MFDMKQMSYGAIYLGDLNIGDVVHIYFSDVLYTNRKVTDINLSAGTLTDDFQKYPNVAGRGIIFLVSKAEIVYKPGDLVRVVSLGGHQLETPVVGVVGIDDPVLGGIVISVPSTTEEVASIKDNDFYDEVFILGEDVEVAGVWE